MVKLVLLLGSLLWISLEGYPQTKKDSLSIEQALSKYSVGNLLFSPDGSKAVAVVSQTGIGPNLPSSHLWLMVRATLQIRQFTNSSKSEFLPHSSPEWEAACLPL